MSGHTGCGKSTQVPQFLLDDPRMGPTSTIVVTQPRRISAISLAERCVPRVTAVAVRAMLLLRPPSDTPPRAVTRHSVAAERCEPVGHTVGYQIRLESARSVRTQLLFCTTGIVLRRITDDPLLTGVSHLVIGA